MKKTEFILAIFASIAVAIGAVAAYLFVAQRNAEITKVTPVIESVSPQDPNELSNDELLSAHAPHALKGPVAQVILIDNEASPGGYVG